MRVYCIYNKQGQQQEWNIDAQQLLGQAARVLNNIGDEAGNLTDYPIEKYKDPSSMCVQLCTLTSSH